MSWWDVVVADFASEYQIRLTQVFRSMPWREFAALVAGLLSQPDTRFARHTK